MRCATLTNGQGVDLVVDSVGGKTLEGSLLCVGYRGRVITVGNVSREGKGIDVGAAERRERVAHGRVLRAGDVPQRRARRADDERPPARHREGRAEGRRRPDVPAVARRQRRTRTSSRARRSGGWCWCRSTRASGEDEHRRGQMSVSACTRSRAADSTSASASSAPPGRRTSRTRRRPGSASVRRSRRSAQARRPCRRCRWRSSTRS